MASHSRHRKPRQPLASRSAQTATGATLAAIATATVTVAATPSQAAPAKPQPSLKEVQDRVDALNHQAEVATQKYDAAKERTGRIQHQVNGLQDSVATKTAAMQHAQDQIGRLAAAQYRDGGMSDVVRLALSNHPDQYLSGADLARQVSQNQVAALRRFAAARKQVDAVRGKATDRLAELSRAQSAAAAQKRTVLAKLRASQDMLDKLTAEQKARLAAQQRAKEAADKRRAEALAKKQAEKAAAERKAAEAKRKASSGSSSSSGSSGSSSSSGSGASSGSSSSSSAAAKAIAFARAQIGKPYVWGATGPDSYDCSGLTQAAWKAAGVSLPRTTWDQVKAGSRVSTDNLKPGDLVFFYDDISHVGLYIGDGMMIHAPHTGTDVKIAPITEMPIYGAVRVGG